MTRKNPRHPFAGEEITGLPEGMAFFRPAQERLPELGSDWCVINIQIEHFKYFTDWFGLEASRDLLSRIGEMIRSAALQAGGMPGQPGLEEFCLIVPYDEDWIHGLFEELQSLIASVSGSMASRRFSVLHTLTVQAQRSWNTTTGRRLRRKACTAKPIRA